MVSEIPGLAGIVEGEPAARDEGDTVLLYKRLPMRIDRAHMERGLEAPVHHRGKEHPDHLMGFVSGR